MNLKLEILVNLRTFINKLCSNVILLATDQSDLLLLENTCQHTVVPLRPPGPLRGSGKLRSWLPWKHYSFSGTERASPSFEEGLRTAFLHTEGQKKIG